jgi:hypothetical protein
VSAQTASKAFVTESKQQLRLEVLRNAPRGKWVALSHDETDMVAVGESFADAAEEAGRKGVADPVVWLIPGRWLPLSL